MPAKVTLTVTEGKLTGQNYEFAERTSCIMGRADECSPQLPNDQEHKIISRHHCLLDINPPDIRVRDFGSLNGTFVNGRKIGGREKNQTPEEGAKVNFPEYDLKEGDKIRLGRTVFQVGVFAPVLCNECSREIDEKKKENCRRAPNLFVCDACWKQLKAAKEKKPLAPRKHVCARCGKDVSKEIGKNRQGDYICLSCKKSELNALVKALLHGGNQGRQELRGLADYALTREIGRGGMGGVYLARNTKTEQIVALKLLLPQVAVKPELKEYFLRETELMKSLNHPHIVRFFESGYADGVFFFTLEYCDRGSIDKLMEQRGGRLSIDEACSITLQALDGLEYAHNVEVRAKLADGKYVEKKGLVHRDIKPGNIFLAGSENSWTVKIGDFGLAKAFDAAGLSGQTLTGTIGGTPCFVPRQQVVNFKHAKPEVDVWAVAACLYNMVCGTGVFPRDFSRGEDVWRAVLSQDAAPIRERNPDIPKKLAAVIDKALVDRPVIGFKSAAAFKRALEGAL
ncbi:MAG: FHA domain-containing protein [Candidatus Abyssobacteria bacterium SURF_5]|uniref:non-specific serine/threonine protein kinase n=1 Tax=Abyssobacteria bacterium (strain SURF_5) TaxID=2093360 RepID=A0A3A4P9D3_ABYX5|nr:MAG: FHA domain-containing protein [Candidatus Abyssubacteria bacterium SURF_5]